MAITAVGCVVRAARQCLTLKGSSATTTSVSRRFSCSRPKPLHRSPPGWVITEGNHPRDRSSASQDATNAVEKTRFRARRGDGDGGRGVGRTRGCPGRGPGPCRKAQFGCLTRGTKRPLARARLVFPSRRGLAMANSLPREPKMLRRQGLRS